MRLIFLTVFFSLIAVQCTLAQRTLSGYVLDERNNPIPMAKVFVKDSADVRTVCTPEGYFEVRLMPGEYFLIVTSTGYEVREVYISMDDADQSRDINLLPMQLQSIEDMEVS